MYDELLSVIKDTESKEIVKQLTSNLKDITGFPVPADLNAITAQERMKLFAGWINHMKDCINLVNKKVCQIILNMEIQ